METTSIALIESLCDSGVSCLFANFGSDHAGLLEAVAARRASGDRVPAIFTCPQEMVALSAAHGHAMISGQPQAVLVHVECGTQSLAGAVHNADKGRVPALIIAGLSPFTQEGELKGGRNEFIQWIQDVPDQVGIVRGYMRYCNEIRTGRNIRQILERALRFAVSDPQGPVYLTIAREILEESVPVAPARPGLAPVLPAGLPAGAALQIACDLAGARRPLIVTSFLGRRPEAVPLAVELCERFGIGLVESVPSRMNFPHLHPLYQGSQWNQPKLHPAIAAADMLLVLDSDVPWIPASGQLLQDAVIHHIDVDPLKQQMPLWDIRATQSYRADAGEALAQILEASGAAPVDEAVIDARRAHYSGLHRQRAASIEEAEARPVTGITIGYFLSRLRARIGPHTIVLNEGITNYQSIFDHLAMERPGSIFASGGGSLGWHGGAAIGAKLASPASEVIAIAGDGCFMFSSPSVVHWMAARYSTPFLHIVLNNGGWTAPRHSMLAVHSDGHGSRARNLDLSFEPAPDYGGIAAAAGGAFAQRLTEASEVDGVIEEALRRVREQRVSAVVEVCLSGGPQIG